MKPTYLYIALLSFLILFTSSVHASVIKVSEIHYDADQDMKSAVNLLTGIWYKNGKYYAVEPATSTLVYFYSYIDWGDEERKWIVKHTYGKIYNKSSYDFGYILPVLNKLYVSSGNHFAVFDTNMDIKLYNGSINGQITLLFKDYNGKILAATNNGKIVDILNNSILYDAHNTSYYISSVRLYDNMYVLSIKGYEEYRINDYHYYYRPFGKIIMLNKNFEETYQQNFSWCVYDSYVYNSLLYVGGGIPDRNNVENATIVVFNGTAIIKEKSFSNAIFIKYIYPYNGKLIAYGIDEDGTNLVTNIIVLNNNLEVVSSTKISGEIGYIFTNGTKIYFSGCADGGSEGYSDNSQDYYYESYFGIGERGFFGEMKITNNTNNSGAGWPTLSSDSTLTQNPTLFPFFVGVAVFVTFLIGIRRYAK